MVLPVIFLCGPSFAQQSSIDTKKEYDVKSVYLYSFGKLTTFPASSYQSTDNTFVIGILGENPLGNRLEKIGAAKTIHNRKLVAKEFKSFENYEPCQILFIPSSTPEKEWKEALEKLSGKPVLIIGEFTGFAKSGGTINFVIRNRKVTFELNIDGSKRQQVQIDPKLKRLATPVREE